MSIKRIGSGALWVMFNDETKDLLIGGFGENREQNTDVVLDNEGNKIHLLCVCCINHGSCAVAMLRGIIQMFQPKRVICYGGVHNFYSRFGYRTRGEEDDPSCPHEVVYNSAENLAQFGLHYPPKS